MLGRWRSDTPKPKRVESNVLRKLELLASGLRSGRLIFDFGKIIQNLPEPKKISA